MTLILELCHRVGEHAASVAQGEWVSSADWCYWNSPQIELRDLTLGIVGFGRVGQRVAELGRAFGMRVLYATPSSRPVSSLGKPVDIETLFSESDFVSLHCNLSASNYEFVNMALDVLSAEPPQTWQSIAGCPKVPDYATHGMASLAARRRIVRTTAENIEAFLRGAPVNVVNSA